MNYIIKGCEWALPGLDPYMVIGAAGNVIISAAIEAGSRDDRIRKVVAGLGFIGSGSWIGLQSKHIKNESHKKITVGFCFASLAYGIYSLADGIMDLMNPNLPLTRYNQQSPCLSGLEGNWKSSSNISQINCMSDDSENMFSKINIPTSQIGNNFGKCNLANAVKLVKNIDVPNVHFFDSIKDQYNKADYFTGSFEEYENMFRSVSHSGGACSAMTLDLAARAENTCHLQTASSKEIINCFENLAPLYNRSNEIFRDRQCGFNTIQVNPRAFDPARAKVEALVSFHSFSVEQMIPNDPVRPEIDHLCDEPLKQFINGVNQAPKGTYFIRTLNLENNDHLERHGHSTVLFKLDNGSIYYDPINGFKGLKNCNLGEQMYSLFLNTAREWFVSYPRLYKISCGSSGCTNLSQ